ncbi:MAG: hypothetical protein JWN38_210 [Candidatus Saccharibacteria bacterium]|nr:hypothetical protein [Candidatus Saccharibacteria bacterium]
MARWDNDASLPSLRRRLPGVHRTRATLRNAVEIMGGSGGLSLLLEPTAEAPPAPEPEERLSDEDIVDQTEVSLRKSAAQAERPLSEYEITLVRLAARTALELSQQEGEK